MLFVSVVAIFGMLCCSTEAAMSDYPAPPPTFEASSYTSWDKTEDFLNGSRRGLIHVPFEGGDISMVRIDLAADCHYDRGYAHGYLLAKEIVEFSGPKLDAFYVQMVMDLFDPTAFPEPIQEILKVIQIKGAKAAPEAFNKALEYVWNEEESFQPEALKKEMEGIAFGMCASPFMIMETKQPCDPEQWKLKIYHVNMLPELIRMACTAYGAWDTASAPGSGLIQLRALDFGSGPFANYTILQNHRVTNGNSFVSISFPAMVGVVTGVSQSGIGLSEKVWMTYDKISIQPGSYEGEADIFVLRDILEQSRTRQEAEEYLINANRTWAIWAGIGDYKSQVFDLVGYKQDSVEVWTDVTAPIQTGMPYMANLAYVDKHPQPSNDGATGTLPTALTDFYGNIDLETSKVITQFHQTGDLHIASYDFTAGTMNVAIGRINAKGDYMPEGGADSSVWKAYNRPYLKFTLADLWAGV